MRHDDRALWKKALITVPAIVAGGLLMGAISNSGFGNPWYDNLTRPAFQPPGWAFGAVWTTLYTMLGIALAAILNEPPSDRRRARPRQPGRQAGGAGQAAVRGGARGGR